MMPRPAEPTPRPPPGPPPMTENILKSIEEKKQAQNENVKKENLDRKIPVSSEYWEKLKAQGPPPKMLGEVTEEVLNAFLERKKRQYPMVKKGDLEILGASAALQHNERWEWLQHAKEEAILLRDLNTGA